MSSFLRLEQYVLDVIEKKRGSKAIRGLLFLFSQGYRGLVALRNKAYDKGWLTSFKMTTPVVSIGNIVAGGTGKTPLVHFLATELQKIGKVAVLSRGFRSRIEKSNQVLNLSQNRVPAAICGDEPFWLAEKMPEVQVWVGRQRMVSAKQACKEGAQFLVLDDGMQHRVLHRDFEIVTCDAQDLLGKNHYLPRGLLRDSPKRLQKADLLVVSGIENEEQMQSAKEALSNYSAAPVVGVQLVAENSAALKGKKVALFCGIAKPERFFSTVKNLGAEVVETWVLPDHGAPLEKELSTFVSRMKEKGAEIVICTEKDWVKMPSLLTYALPIVPLKMQLQIKDGENHWNQLIEKIKEKVASHD